MNFKPIRITIDKDYYFPSIESITLEDFIKVVLLQRSEERDDKIISSLLNCSEELIESLEDEEYEKLVLLAKHLLESPSMALDYDIPFLPLGSYPFGQFADWLTTCRRFDFDIRCAPYTIAYLRPGTSFRLRNSEFLNWANKLPACVGNYYFNKILLEYEELNKTFVNLKGEEPTEVEIKAGIEHLSKYGEYLTLHKLAGGDITKVETIAKMSVNQVLTYLSADKDVSTYIKEINTLKGQKPS